MNFTQWSSADGVTLSENKLFKLTLIMECVYSLFVQRSTNVPEIIQNTINSFADADTESLLRRELKHTHYTSPSILKYNLSKKESDMIHPMSEKDFQC